MLKILFTFGLQKFSTFQLQDTQDEILLQTQEKSYQPQLLWLFLNSNSNFSFNILSSVVSVSLFIHLRKENET